MANSIFSTYSTAENRVTSTILAVFEKLNSTTVTRILQILMEDSTVELIEYENQVKASDSVPDGRIKDLFDYIIETKVFPNSIKKKQIENHCKMLKYDFSKLLVLTPDFEFPRVLKDIDSKLSRNIIWGNFDKIIIGIDSVLEESPLSLDREKFLLLELKEFIINERLTSEDYSKKALIVPAGKAWVFYKKYKIYRCQPNRTFQPTSYMGFYADQQIKEYFPMILGYVDSLNIQTEDLQTIKVETVNGVHKDIIDKLDSLKKQPESAEWDSNYKYIVLTDLKDKNTFINTNPIENDKKSYSDKATAFVQKQTYLNIEDIKGKKYTSEL